MGFLIKGVSFGVILLSAYVYYQLNQVPDIPKVEETWWGPEKPRGKEDTSVKPFKINISDDIIKDLKFRLENALPFQPPLEDVKQHYGMNTNLLMKIAEFWKTKYVWSERQAFLNKNPQFKTNIQGLDIHFIHVKPQNTKGVKVLPMLLMHGWPGSVREFYEMIPLLTTPQKGQKFVFELIIPSLPGYGFSDATSKPGLGTNAMALIMKNLMTRLGFNRFYVQGGDWGGIISSIMAVLYPEHIIGLHSNMCASQSPKSTWKLIFGSVFPSLIFTEKEAKKNLPLSNLFGFLMLEFGYFHLQATKPDTVGVGLRDSPIGLAAYILEKFTTWTNPEWKNLEDGGLTKKFTMEQLLDNVMIYWVTRSITTSCRLYAEGMNAKQYSTKIEQIPITVPTGCARFEHELTFSSKSTLEDRYKNLVHLSTYEDGGHFAAFELPNVLAQDIIEFVNKVENPPKTEK